MGPPSALASGGKDSSKVAIMKIVARQSFFRLFHKLLPPTLYSPYGIHDTIIWYDC